VDLATTHQGVKLKTHSVVRERRPASLKDR